MHFLLFMKDSIAVPIFTNFYQLQNNLLTSYLKSKFALRRENLG